jgi:hypothetical protein
MQNGNVTLPFANTLPAGGTISFTSHQGSTTTQWVLVQDPNNEFIYNGGVLGTNNRKIAILPGESLTLMSRGTTEWDTAGGTALVKYEKYPSLQVGRAFNSTSSSPVTMNTINAYMYNGNLWLASVSGTISVYGQALWIIYGAGPQAQTVALSSLTSTYTNAAGTPFTNHQGDTVEAYVTDTTNGAMYRIIGHQYSSGTVTTSTTYNVIIEELY